MHSAIVLSALSCAFFSTIHAFEFTGPDSSKKLDLTRPINITWDVNKGSFSEPDARKLHLWFHAIGYGDSGSYASRLAELPLSSSYEWYEWDPEAVVEGFKGWNNSLSSDAVHTFEARMLDRGDNKLATVESDKYAVEGFDFIKDNDSKRLQSSFYTRAIAITIIGLAIL
ncbi:hypothetical protein NW768_012147 [Fusarium equiseti]|uniref:Uncharacterized protein n=1 Tax=Fusarium equiseti TaxID=61235 RepID=A0ABQ8QVG3_FUSEQ|nr:hypothetical protein NW768_012147 [Fusarium equiseti]